MEASIDMALLEGKSAEALSRDIRSLLKDPDALFRRVRDKDTGELRMSRAMAAFHPGPGRYRSAYKNAMRLARSEINMAYRSSDSQTAQEFDACVGIRVNLSNNHTCNGKPFVDICDELEGNYPKSFIFRGWHPQCRCFITYILKTDDEFWRDLENGENNESVNTVHDVPNQFKEWVGKNEERIAKAEERGTLPYFLRDNQKYTKQQIEPQEKPHFFTHPVSGKTFQVDIPFDERFPKEVNINEGEAISDLQSLKNRERIYVFTDGGRIFTFGATSENPFQIDLSVLTDEAYKGAKTIHNHPGGGIFSFDDVASFLSYGIKENILVSDADSYVYTLSRIDFEKPYNHILFRKEWMHKQIEYQRKMSKANINIVNNAIIKDLAEKYGFTLTVRKHSQ